jgi:hypothetical protein
MRITGKGGKNRRRGKGDGEESKRELEFKEDGKLSALKLGSRRVTSIHLTLKSRHFRSRIRSSSENAGQWQMRVLLLRWSY